MGFYLGHSSKSTAYTGFHLDGYPSGSRWGHTTMAAQSWPRQVFILAIRVSQQLTKVFTLTAIPQGVS